MNRQSERGATALFIVIFAVILISTITLSFMAIMIREQNRAINNDLSQSAYDSALAGVEDAKRVIMKTRGTNPAIAESASQAIQASQTDCHAIGRNAAGTPTDDNETMIQSSSAGGAELNQAYTCVKVKNVTDDYEVTLQQDQVALVPLRMVGEVNQVRVQWHYIDIDGKTTAESLAKPSAAPFLYARDVWNKRLTPALVQMQTITPQPGFRLSDFDNADTNSAIYLYPTNDSSHQTAVMGERTPNLATPNTPFNASCIASELNMQYACEALVQLRRPVAAQSGDSYLVLRPIYRNAKFRITGLKDSQLVQFDGVQPQVDSTGRANDIFRRVEARLSLGGAGESGSLGAGVLPAYALDTAGSLCKHFYVTVNDNGKASGRECTP